MRIVDRIMKHREVSGRTCLAEYCIQFGTNDRPSIASNGIRVGLPEVLHNDKGSIWSDPPTEDFTPRPRPQGGSLQIEPRWTEPRHKRQGTGLWAFYASLRSVRMILNPIPTPSQLIFRVSRQFFLRGTPRSCRFRGTFGRAARTFHSRASRSQEIRLAASTPSARSRTIAGQHGNLRRGGRQPLLGLG
jgi:hypothetical protein